MKYSFHPDGATMKIFCHNCGMHTNHNIIAKERILSDPDERSRE